MKKWRFLWSNNKLLICLCKLFLCVWLLVVVSCSCNEDIVVQKDFKDISSFDLDLYNKLKSDFMFLECCDLLDFKKNLTKILKKDNSGKKNITKGSKLLEEIEAEYGICYIYKYVSYFNKDKYKRNNSLKIGEEYLNSEYILNVAYGVELMVKEMFEYHQLNYNPFPKELSKILSPRDYLVIRGLTAFFDDYNQTVEKIDAILDCGGIPPYGRKTYLCEVPELVKNALEWYSTNSSGGSSYTGGNGGVPSIFKFPEGSNYEKLYPKFTEYLKNQIPTILKNDYIKTKLKQWGHFTDEQLKKYLSWNSGLEIQIVEHLQDKYGTPANGMFDKTHPNRVSLDKSLVDWLEGNEACDVQLDAIAFLIGVTLLHELVHFGDYSNNNDGSTIEEGEAWELNTYGKIIGTTNAEGVMQIWLKKNK